MLRLAALLVLLAVSVAARAAPMTNDDVVKMVKAGVGDSLVLQQIDRSEAVFDTSVDGIIRLKQSGVSDTVINRMMNKRPAAPAAPVSASVPPPSSGPILNNCPECGVVELVREVEKGGQAGGTGAVAGGVAGAVVGRGVSNDRNRTFGTIAGAVGGAVAGHVIEKNINTSKSWEVVVRHEDGAVRTYPQAQQPAWRQGDRVKVVGGVLGPL